MDYQAVWWHLFHRPCSSEWRNCLSLVELLFSLAASNGKLERTFLQLKIIKTEEVVTFEQYDLLRLNADVIPLASSDANPSSGKKKVENKLAPKKGLKERKKTTDTPKPYRSTAVDDVINVDTDSDNDVEKLSESECEADNEDNMYTSETQNVLDCWDSWLLV